MSKHACTNSKREKIECHFSAGQSCTVVPNVKPTHLTSVTDCRRGRVSNPDKLIDLGCRKWRVRLPNHSDTPRRGGGPHLDHEPVGQSTTGLWQVCTSSGTSGACTHPHTKNSEIIMLNASSLAVRLRSLTGCEPNTPNQERF